MAHPMVFISYSHKDEAEKNELVSHLEVLRQAGLIDTWVDDQIGVGRDWADAIDEAMSRSRVAILLITKNFLTSDFILRTEVPRLLQRRHEKGLIIFPVITRHCAWRSVDWLAKMEVRPRHSAPVWRENGRYVEQELTAIAEEVADIIAQQATDSAEPLEEAERDKVAGKDFDPKMDVSSPELAFIQNTLVQRSLTLFIGADLPRNITGQPSRADMAYELAHRQGLDETLSLAEVSQRVEQAGNRWVYTDFLRNVLDTTGKSPQPFHQYVVRLTKMYQLETIITTTYDNLLELAFQQAEIGLNRVIRGTDVNFITPNRPTLLKLYGDIQQPDTLVVTDRDHSALLRSQEKEAVLDEVRRAFRRNSVLFLGYNLADADFHFLFDQIAESRFARQAYAAWPGLPDSDLTMWRDRGIVILPVSPLNLLQKLIPED